MKLFPAIVTLHLLGGLVLLALLCRQAVVYEHAQRGKARVPVPFGVRAWLFAAVALVWLQSALGGWVSTNYAVLACTDFPTCQGSWWPEMHLRQGFELWRDLGMTAAGEHLDFAALTAIHYVHRLMAYAVLPALAFTAWQLHRSGVLGRQARWIAALALWQLGTGLSNIVLGWPIAAAVGHTGGAAALVVVLTWALCESRVGAGVGVRACATAGPFRMTSRLRQFHALTKPRVIQLIVFCALIGMVLAVPGVPELGRREAGACSPAWASGWWPAPPPSSTAWSKRASTPRCGARPGAPPPRAS